MKKVTTYIFLGLIFCTLNSCDFLRKVAGRPTSGQLSEKAILIAEKKSCIEDSLRLVKTREAEVLDSLATISRISAAGAKISGTFFYGNPLEPLQHRYHLLIGVYKTAPVMNKQLSQVRSLGYQPFTISFKGGAKAVVLFGSDDLKEVADMLEKAKADAILPKDAWIHDNLTK